MPLNSELANARSPLRRLVAEHLPHLGSVLRADLKQQLGSVSRPIVSPPAGAPRVLLGHAIEQRLVLARAFRSDLLLNPEVDRHITRFLVSYGEIGGLIRNLHLFDELRIRLREDGNSVFPPGEPILGTDPDRAARMAVLLGLFEQSYRRMPPDLLMEMATQTDTLDDALALVDSVWVEDVNAVTQLSLPLLPGSQDSILTISPTMSAGYLVGGADGDLVIDGTLIDVKTSTTRHLQLAPLLRSFLYVLFDVDDEYKIKRTGVLFARHGVLAVWDVADVLHRSGGLTLKQARRRVIEPLRHTNQ